MSSEIKPKIRPDAALTIRDYFMKCIEAYEVELVRTCLTCLNFNEAREGCRLANFDRPPARVIAYGCPAYFNEEEIPF